MTHDHKFFASLNCPSPVTWNNDIKQMFTPLDVAHMKSIPPRHIDLSNYDQVKMYSSLIYNKVVSGDMPPAGFGEDEWPQEWKDKFGCWIQQGCPQ